jgi:outer membrane protein TolC
MKALLILALLGSQTLRAQTRLDAYLQEGLSNNEGLKQQEFLFEKSLHALKEAKSLFVPTVAFNATYTMAGGGRTIDFPAGDLLNPAYTTLNQLTGSNSFPQIENKSILINPNNFYDAKLHTVYPVINAERIYNQKIKTGQADLQKIEVAIYKRELVKEIKTAYYNYLQACEAATIYENATKLVRENARINTALFNNEKINRTAVTRSNNELTKILAQVSTANQNVNNARAYFNFLLNRSLDATIEIDTIKSVPSSAIVNDSSVVKREELLKLYTAKSINKNIIALSNASKKPRLNSFLDLGSQGFDFNVNNKTPYYFFGLSLEWDIFSGGKNKSKVGEAEADQKSLEAQTIYVQQQLALQLKIASNLFAAAVVNYQAAVSQVQASEKYYADVLRLYKEGAVLFIELLDAQNQLVSAQLQANISLYDTWIKQTEIERANAGLIIK